PESEATYSTARVTVTVRTRTTAVKEAVTLPALPTADSVTVPAPKGVAVLEATPAAFVKTVQLPAPQAPNSTAPRVVENTTATPTTGVTPSASNTRTANAVPATVPVVTVPAGAVTSRITSGSGAAY